MSATAARSSKAVRRACQSCRERKARFQHAGRVRSDADHSLCFECFRAERERRRARLLADVRSGAPARLPFDGADASATGLDERALAHRRRMLAHLQSTESRR